MTHEELKAKLRGNEGKALVKDLTQCVYDWADKVPAQYYEYRVIEELTVRYQTGDKTRLGLDRNDHYLIDAVLFIQPGWRAVNQRQCYTVGLELKGNLPDLTQDKKYEKYIGWTDFFFFGVTSDLIEAAIEKAAGNDRVGVIDIEQGLIVKLPKRCKVPIDNRLWLYEQVIYNTVFKDIKAVSFSAEDVDIVQPELQDIGAKILPEYNNVSNNDTNNYTGNNVSNEGLINNAENNDVRNDTLNEADRKSELSDEEKAARKAAAEARKEYRRKRAIEVAEQGAEMPESTRIVLSTLPDQVQQAYHIIREKPSINAHGIELQMGVGEATAKRFVGRLIDVGLVERHGSRKTGGYVIKPQGGLKYASRCRECKLLQAFNEQRKQVNTQV